MFLKICIKYGEKIARYPELLEGFANKLKDAVNEDDDVKDEVYSLCDLEKIEKWNVLNLNGTLNEEEKNKTLSSSNGVFNITTQF